MEGIKVLRKLNEVNEEKDKIISPLKGRLADMKQYSRINYLVVTGLETMHWTYARATPTPTKRW